MGILQRLTEALSTAAARSGAFGDAHTPSESEDAIGRVRSGFSCGEDQDLVKLTGATTFAKEAMASLAERHRLADGGHLEIDGVLQREPENPVDPMAVAALVEGEKISYLPSYLAQDLELARGTSRRIKVQIFTEVVARGLRGEVWVWLGDGSPRWFYSATDRPPMSSQAKSAALQSGRSAMVAEAPAEGGDRADSFRAGMVDGVHYLELVEPIKQLKREGRLQDALVLCYKAIEGAEGGRDGREPAPAYTEHAAIIHRKLGQRDEEIAVLKRWLRLCPAGQRDGSRIGQRLAKLIA
jgi:hypothetical protein